MAKLLKEFDYTNSLGIPKRLCVYEKNAEGKFPVHLWEMRHGEFCGHGEMTHEELNDYLEHFGITERV